MGGVNLDAVGILSCVVKFGSQQHKIKIFVLLDYLLPVPMLLGRVFLNLFGIDLRFSRVHSVKKLNINHEINNHLKLNSMSYFCESDFTGVPSFKWNFFVIILDITNTCVIFFSDI